MPIIKSAKKRLRQNGERRVVNLPISTRIKSSRRAFLEAVESGDEGASARAFSAFCSSLDKGAKRGLIKANTAIRSKQRASKRLRAIAST